MQRMEAERTSMVQPPPLVRDLHAAAQQSVLVRELERPMDLPVCVLQ